jgi:uncharacterized Tic20 family protein
MTDIDVSPDPIDEDPKDSRMWATIMHLSLLSGFVLPLIGSLLVPIVVHMLKKDEVPSLTAHFNIVMNWIISVVIYGAAAAVLAVVTLGLALPLMFLVFAAIAVATLAFSIIGAIKANDGETWPYPLSLRIIGNG